MMEIWYSVLYWLICPFFNLVHPSRAVGLEHLPKEGGVLLCPNHTAASDPLFIVFSLGRKRRVSIMAKAELMRIPILGFLLKKAGVFGVDRGKNDVAAIKTAMKRLKEGERLVLFPEGTRVNENEEIHEAKNGAAMLSVRMGVPIVPVYIPGKKNWFSPTPVIFGMPYFPNTEEKRGTAEEYKAIGEELMARIAALGEQVKR